MLTQPKPQIDTRISEIFEYCREVAATRGKPLAEVINSHARGLEKSLRDQVYKVTELSVQSKLSYGSVLLYRELCPLAFGRSCAYGPKSN